MTDEVWEDHYPKASIIIPYFNRWDLTHQRMMELYKFAPDYCEIILVDDCSTETEPGGGLKWWMDNTKRHTIRYYRNQVNSGMGVSLNNGAKLARGDYLIHMSNDVILYGDIISDIITLIGRDDRMLIGGRIVDFPGGWNEFNIEGKTYVIPYAEGWLVACTKVGWKKLGGFDPAYGRFDYEDMDLSAKALSLGFNIVGLNSPNARHMVGQTIASLGIDRQKITEHNRSIFQTKWNSRIPEIGRLK